MKTMVSPNTASVIVNGRTYSTPVAGLTVANVPDADAAGLMEHGWRDAAHFQSLSKPTQTARQTQIDDVAGNFAPNSTYGGVFPSLNVEDALAQLAARLTKIGA
ncbi:MULTISPECIES: hypothetical protein [Burkholderia]|uniref:hypothetical protein n=1 Tax=Burkholderia TaxID=32008 RepID=UPI0008770721|nr:MULTISPECIES: hypothetical protein [Burkholderia]TCT29411.1 hypothetical protein EC918_10698 [Burkholderia vietnamiensis]SCZ29488.1 hypothetical protein SAMN02787148_107201 [Burkholderia vietnamiensis]SFX71858.1 hypothetical protein SAMN02787160_107202 [Burkholderia vietnamiensis]